MQRWTTRARMAAAVAAVVALTACGDARLKKLSTGIEKDSVAIVMGTDTPHRMQPFLTDGKNWEVLLYAKDNAAAEDSIEWRTLSPVILADGKVVGWGWGYWDDQAAALNIPVPPKD